MNNKKIIILLLCLCCFHIICNHIWIKKDYFSFSPEKFYTLCQKHELLVLFKEKTYGLKGHFDKFKKIFKAIFKRYKPNLILAYTAVINYYFGDNIYNSPLFTNIPFLVLAIVFVFLLGKEFFSKEAGLLAAFIISFYPSFFGMSRSYGIDFPQIGLVAAVFYCLIKVSKNMDIKYLIVFIILFSISILANPRMIFFLVGPLIYIFYKVVQKKTFGSLLKILIALILTIIFTSVWWFHRIRLIMFLPRQMFYFVTRSFLSGPSLQTSVTYATVNYFLRAVGHISLLFGLPLIWSLAWLIRSKVRHKSFLVIFLIVPGFFLPVYAVSFDRYFFPLFIGFALVTAIWLVSIKKRILKYALISLLSVLSFLQFFDLSFGTHFLPGIVNGANKIIEKNIPEYENWARPPSIYDKAVAANRFFDIIADYKGSELLNTRILLTGKCFVVNRGVFEYIFFARSDKQILKKIPVCEKFDYQDYDFAIIVTHKDGGAINRASPDIEFFKSSNCGGYFQLIRRCYGPRTTSIEREARYKFFKNFRTLDCFIGERYLYYLCINPEKDLKTTIVNH